MSKVSSSRKRPLTHTSYNTRLSIGLIIVRVFLLYRCCLTDSEVVITVQSFFGQCREISENFFRLTFIFVFSTSVNTSQKSFSLHNLES